MIELIRSWERRFLSALRSSDRPEIHEIVRGILADLESNVQSRDLNDFVFPFNYIAITLYAQSAKERAAFEGGLLANYELRDKVRAHLSKYRVPSEIEVVVQIVQSDQAAAGQRFAVTYDYQQGALPTLSNPAQRVRVITGTATPRELNLGWEDIRIGRDSESPGGRHNDVVFDESESSVSRIHATITWDAAQRGYVISDDQSRFGTVVLRKDQRHRVLPGRPKLLQDGDRILLGDAAVEFSSR
jgi:hypothetical protein